MVPNSREGVNEYEAVAHLYHGFLESDIVLNRLQINFINAMVRTRSPHPYTLLWTEILISELRYLVSQQLLGVKIRSNQLLNKPMFLLFLGEN